MSAYDAVDQIRQQVDALGKISQTFQYDERGHLTAWTDALDQTTQFIYDEASSWREQIDALQRKTTFRYDGLGRLIESVDALGGKSRQEFDAGGRPTKLEDPNGNKTDLGFDLQGRLVKEQVAGSEAVRYTYDAQDLLKQVRNGRGQVRELEYDVAGRLIKLIEPEGMVSYTYDANGNVLTVTDSQGTIARTYDALNRVMTYTDVRGKRLHYAYDEVGHLVKLTYPDGKEVEYEYDGAGQLVKVKDWAGRETRYEYDGNGRLVKEVRPNGTMRSRRYDEVGRIIDQGEWDGEGRLISEFQLSYDAVGNIVREESLPKLESVSLPMPVTMSYSDGNQLVTYQGQAVRLDADGNLVWGPVRERMEELKFDSRNRLVEAGGVRYQYDAENQRIGVNETRYVVNSQPLLSQVLVKEEGGRETFYVYGLGLLGEEREGRYWSYHFDVRGSTVALSDKNGEVVERFGYGPYGELVSGNGGRTPFLFNGMFGVMADGNGFYYMRARFYSPSMKRFVNRDVVGGSIGRGQTLNRYTFVTGRPVSLVDPFGLEQISPEQLKPTITKEQLDEILKKIAEQNLAPDKPESGCEARAHIIAQIIRTSGYEARKVWLINYHNELTLKGKEYEWSFHVAAMVKMENGIKMILDPLFFSGAVNLETWKNGFTGIEHSADSAFGEPPQVCEGAKNVKCRTRRLAGSYIPFKLDSLFESIDEYAESTIQCMIDSSLWHQIAGCP